MKLIDASALRKSIETDRDASDMPKMWYVGIGYAINHIVHAPTIDAVPVVRCKDCKEYCFPISLNRVQSEQFCTCMRYGLPRTADDFCSRGERRTDE